MAEKSIDNGIGHTDEEYETQFFGFGREKLKESFKSLVDFAIQSRIHQAKSNLTSSKNIDRLTADRISSKCDALMKFCLENSEKPLEGLYSEVDKFFSIPVDVLLSEDEDYIDVVNEDEIKCLKADIEDLRRRVERADAVNKVMTRELHKLDETHILQKAQQAVDILRFAREGLIIPPYTQLQTLSKINNDQT